jgi:hypothetical protein
LIADTRDILLSLNLMMAFFDVMNNLCFQNPQLTTCLQALETFFFSSTPSLGGLDFHFTFLNLQTTPAQTMTRTSTLETSFLGRKRHRSQLFALALAHLILESTFNHMFSGKSPAHVSSSLWCLCANPQVQNPIFL